MLASCLHIVDEPKRGNALLHTFSEFSQTPHNTFLQM